MRIAGILITILLLGIVLFKVKKGWKWKNLIVSVLLILLCTQVVLAVFHSKDRKAANNWCMKINIVGFNEGYEKTAYVYKNKKVVIQSNLHPEEVNKYSLNKETDLEKILRYIKEYEKEKEQSRSYYFNGNTMTSIADIFNTDDVGYRYRIELKDGTIKEIPPQNVELKEFFDQISLNQFATVKETNNTEENAINDVTDDMNFIDNMGMEDANLISETY